MQLVRESGKVELYSEQQQTTRPSFLFFVVVVDVDVVFRSVCFVVRSLFLCFVVRVLFRMFCCACFVPFCRFFLSLCVQLPHRHKIFSL